MAAGALTVGLVAGVVHNATTSQAANSGSTTSTSSNTSTSNGTTSTSGVGSVSQNAQSVGGSHGS